MDKISQLNEDKSSEKPQKKLGELYRGSKRPFHQRKPINYGTLYKLRKHISEGIYKLGVESGLEIIERGVPLKGLIESAFDEIDKEYSIAQVKRYKKALALKEDAAVRIYRGTTHGRPWMAKIADPVGKWAKKILNDHIKHKEKLASDEKERYKREFEEYSGGRINKYRKVAYGYELFESSRDTIIAAADDWSITDSTIWNGINEAARKNMLTCTQEGVLKELATYVITVRKLQCKALVHDNPVREQMLVRVLRRNLDNYKSLGNNLMKIDETGNFIHDPGGGYCYIKNLTRDDCNTFTMEESVLGLPGEQVEVPFKILIDENDDLSWMVV